LIDAIKIAMTKAKRRPATVVAAPVAAAAAPTNPAEIQALNEKIAKMQAEIDGLKKQMAQLLAFVKQKVK
jgi:hypothetical protein